MKKSLLLITALLVFSICFSIVAYGGDHDTPIIPITNTSNVTGSEGDGTGDNGEPSGGVEVSKKETTDESSSSDGGWELPTELIDQTVSIKKCTVSSIKNRVYTGKAIKPAVTVKNGSTTLKSGVDYTLSYKNNTKIGVATVTIKGKGNYKDSVNVTFKIVPKSTALSKLTTPKKKQLKVTWKKQTTQTTGYQIQYSTSSKFTAKTTKTVTVSNNKTTAKTISKLTSKKKYFVRIRTYKTVSGKKYCSSWSAVKSIKVK